MASEVRRSALATNLMLFFASLAFAGLLMAVFGDAFWTIEGVASGIGETEQAAQGQAYITSFWELLPVVIALLGLIQLVGAAAVEARLP